MQNSAHTTNAPRPQHGQRSTGAELALTKAVMAVIQQAVTGDEARVLCLGDGPFTRHNMAAFLENLGIRPLAIRWEVRPALLVCGRGNIHAGRVQRLLRSPHHAPVVCAQEHALFALYRLQSERANTCRITSPNHPVERWLRRLDEAPCDSPPGEADDRALGRAFRPGDVLRVLPYVDAVIHGTRARRRKVLRQAYVMDLRALKRFAPQLEAQGYSDGLGADQDCQSWGAQRSATRLKHVAESLLCAWNNPASLNTPLRNICRKDLHWLRQNIYDVGDFDFLWPSL